jgi:periplasmic protein TonB
LNSMSYQALLFCPDEKTARVVTQVLTELEFTVEPCHEPFSAVKKLMVQHFDAIVVDCDNEQNAALLFKSARNSGSNQASLAVAVVEGQTGVAKAFRLGANLVLTKPIHVEQSKGTLRVARGLLRKGQAAKPAGVTASSSAPAAVSQPFVPSPFPPPPQSSATPPSASAAAFELDAEPAPQPDAVDAALLEYMPDSPVSGGENSAQIAAESDPSKQYPWQPRKPLAEPMASALRRAAEAAGKTEFDAAAPRPAVAPQAGHPQSGAPRIGISQTGSTQTGSTQTRTGAAAAPARAKEIPLSAARELGLEPTASTMPAPAKEEIKRIEDPSAGEGWESNSASAATEAPSFASLDGDQQASDAGGSKKTLLIAVVVVGLAAAGYFGWTKLQSAHTQPAVQQSAAPASPITAQPSQPAPSVPEAQAVTGEVAGQQTQPAVTDTTVVPVPSKPSAAVVAEIPGSKTPAPAPVKAAPAEDDVTVVKVPAPAPALVVQNGTSTQAKPPAEAEEPEQAPEATSIASGNSSSAVSGIVNTNAMNAQRAPQQAMRISQGVSQGLIVRRVQPIYPARAQQMRLEGTVELQANISQTGSITGVKQLSGDLILGRAAMDAVRLWKYKPYFLNGEPIEIQTQITVNFKLP